MPPSDRQLDEETLLKVLEERGVVDQVMNTLDLSPSKLGSPREESPKRTSILNPSQPRSSRPQRPPVPHPSRPQPPLAPRTPMESKTQPDMSSHFPSATLQCEDVPSSSSKRCLFVQVLGGRAFLDHLSDPSPCPHTHFTLHVHFRGQRYHSRDVPCACEPDFREGFLLELEKKLPSSATPYTGGSAGRMVSCADALSISDPVQIALTTTNHRGEVDLVGTCDLEWRMVLCEVSGRFPLTVELRGVGAEAKITPGILDLRIDIVPQPSDPVHLDLFSAQLGLEKQRRSEKERLFLVYAKQWWKEYLQLRLEHSQRLVKIFASNEAGDSQLVSCYARPLRAGRLLDSPRHAARFVSLFPFEKTGSVGRGGCASEMWTNGFAMLISRKGVSWNGIQVVRLTGAVAGLEWGSYSKGTGTDTVRRF